MTIKQDSTEAPVPAHEAALKFQRGPTPSWIEQVDAGKPASQDGFVSWLLLDEQFDLTTTTPKRFFRYVFRANNSHGADRLAEIRIGFNPSYEALTLHQVSILRDNQRLDALEDADIDFMRVEQDMYARVYRGDYAVVIQVRGLEPNDEIEYAYTMEGTNPALLGNTVFFVRHTFEEPLGRRFFRALQAPDTAVQLKHEGPALSVETWSSDNGTEHRIDILDLPRNELEHWVPFESDHQVSATCLSSFSAWPDVGRWACELYATADDQAVAALTEQFLAGAHDPVLMAIAYVQERIRYVSTSFGQGGYRPRALDVVLKRRYGDCKDKSLLLATLLKRLGHQAELALVNTQAPRGPLGGPPTPSAFDHVIVRAFINGETYWIDATMTGQRGPLALRGRPHSMAALMVGSNTERLTEIPALPDAVIGHFSDGVIDLSEGPGNAVTLRNDSVAIGADAEDMRRGIAIHGIEGLKRIFEEMESQQHGDVLGELFEIHDDEQTNRIRIKSGFRLIDPWRLSPDQTASYKSILCHGTDLVPIVGIKQRKLPLRLLTHPLHHVHRETVILPKGRMPRDLSLNEIARQNSGFKFSRKHTLTENRLSVDVETKTLAHSLPAEEALDAIRDQAALKDAHVLTLTFDHGA